MKIVFHERYKEVYTFDPAASPGRMEAIMKELEDAFDVVEPPSATLEDLLLVHSRAHVERVKKTSEIYEIAALAAGGAILCAELALGGEAAFGVLRPPGHHASYESSWGFCYFNNVAIALKRLMNKKKIGSALIVDIDLHFGDGTSAIFRNTKTVKYYHLVQGGRKQQLDALQKFLESEEGYDILAVSAGFDRGKLDWGGQLEVEDYNFIATLLKNASERICNGRRFAVLEGGYNHSVLGRNVSSFIYGFA